MKVRVSRSVERFFNIVLGALAMLVVALVSAFITMRLAIHGHEVRVPSLAGLSLSDASRKTSALGLSLKLENRFYSANVAPGRILAQYPAAGAVVRREWPVRVTESLGTQQVAIPSVLGQSERTATINIRRVGLEPGVTAHIAAAGQPGIVIAQTPAPNASGVDSPRVSILLSDSEDATAPVAWVMPSLSGLTLASAVARVSAIGLHVASAEDLNLPANVPAAPAAGVAPAQPATPGAATTAHDAVVPSVGTVIAQSPAAGHRVVKGDAVHITLTN